MKSGVETRLFEAIVNRQHARNNSPLVFNEVMPADGGTADLHVLDLEEQIAHLTAENQRQRLLLSEANHRAKNMLALVQAVVSQTLRTTTSPRAASDAILARIAALGQAQNMLLDEPHTGALLGEVVHAALAPHGEVGVGGRIRIRGPLIRLNERQTLALSLVLHELGTNAVKYGALSNASGYIDVCWEALGREGRRRVRLAWAEHDGPSVEKPPRTGFGTTLIRRALADSLLGEVSLRYERSGLVFVADWPVQKDASAREH